MSAAVAILGGALAMNAAPAAAHTEFDLDEVAPGSIVTLNLLVENESDTAGTTMVEIRFPEPLVVVALPAVGCWTAEPVEDDLGEEAIGILWTRSSGSPDDDPKLPMTIGPLPDIEGRLQFKVLQTYSDGHEDAWIDDWPEGSPEPPHPGPILNLVEGAPGTIAESTDEIAVDVSAPPSSGAAEHATTAIETAGDTALSVADGAIPDSTAPTC